MLQIAIVANRAPFSPISSEAGLRLRRAAGGLVNTFDSLRGRKDVTWFAVPMSGAEQETARRGPIKQQGFQVRFVSMERQDYHYAYNEVYNGVLWPICHGMTGMASTRLRTSAWSDLWEGYKTYNRQVSKAIAAHLPDGSLVLAQDLYFVFLAAELHRLGATSLRSVLFLHLPFATPTEFAVLPPPIAREILVSMTRFGAVGFQTQRWERAFNHCCRSLDVESPRTFVAAAAPPIVRLRRDSASPECAKELAYLEGALAGRQMLAQLDRMEPTKNLLGSLQAYNLLLAAWTDIKEKVMFVALAHLTRQDLDEYQDYAARVRRLCEKINEEHGSPSWQPVLLREDFPHFLHVAALRRYDVLLANSVRDGMNLIALEGPQLNERHGVSVVSPGVGAFERQRGWVLQSNPHNAAVTAQVLRDALTLDAGTRAWLFAGLRAVSAKVDEDDEFVSRQVEAALER